MKKQNKSEIAYRYFVHGPDDLSQSYVAWAEKMRSQPGFDYGCVMDKYILPMRPGDVMAVIGRPGNAKSSFMAYLAKRAAKSIVKQGNGDTEAAVYVTWEQTAEEIDSFWQTNGRYSTSDMAWGKASMKDVLAQSVKRVNLPVWVFGESKRHEGIRRPPMTAKYVYEAIQVMREKRGRKPVFMCLDYIQLMPVSKGRSKIEEVSEAIYEAKQLAIRMGLPVIIGVQAARRVDDYKNQMPTMSDAQWSSAIEQTADKIISLWRPIRYYEQDERPTINIGGVDYDNDEDLMIIRLLKQRFEQGYGVWAVRFKPQTLELHDYDPTLYKAAKKEYSEYTPINF